VASTPQHCEARRRDGQPCCAPALTASGLCFVHDPAQVAKRAAARQQGGYHRANVVRLRALVPPRLLGVYEQLEAALGEVHAGQLDPKVAGAMAAVARAMVSVLQAGEVEDRLRTLEARVKGRTHGG
jgi:hypothetical protein